MSDIHSCSYYCDRPECVKRQRDELRERLNGGGGEAVANVVKTAPEKIYIVIGDDCPPEEPFTNLDEVTWCQDNVNNNDIVYVRADLAAPQPQQAAPGDVWEDGK